MTTKNFSDQPKPHEGLTQLGDMWERIMKRYGYWTYPHLNDKYDIVGKIAQTMKNRRQFGIDKYGMALQAFNGRNALEDLMAEQLDSLVYSEQVLLEHPELSNDMLKWQEQTLSFLYKLFEINELKTKK